MIGVRIVVLAIETIAEKLASSLADTDARAISVTATIGPFNPARLAFAWTRNNQVPVILGQVNFFMEYDVCFFRSQLVFDVKPKSSHRTDA